MSRRNATGGASVSKIGWMIHSLRTGIAAAVSLAIARLFHMPEAYWAAITTLIVMQSTLGAAWKVSTRRFVGTALGAALGALMAAHFEPRVVVFGAAIVMLGIICAILRLDQTAYRFAGITLTIVALVARGNSSYVVAVHRFLEVSIGIVVGLALTALWPQRELVPPRN